MAIGCVNAWMRCDGRPGGYIQDSVLYGMYVSTRHVHGMYTVCTPYVHMYSIYSRVPGLRYRGNLHTYLGLSVGELYRTYL
jgi:hypothetical protein